MTVKQIKDLVDACYEAKRIRELRRLFLTVKRALLSFDPVV